MLQDLKMGALYGAAAIIAIIAILCGGALWYCLNVPGRSYQGSPPPATRAEIDLAANLRRHVEAIANRPHNVRHYEALEAAAVYIEQTLNSLGYVVVSQRFDAHDRVVRNLEVTIEPSAPQRELSSIIVGAHYDSAGESPGANDNGSGVAAVIELARLLRGASLQRRLRFVLFVNEEPPYFQTSDMGSFRYAGSLAERNEQVTAMISLETLGYYSDQPGSQAYPRPFGAFFADRGDFVAFVGMPGSRDVVHRAIRSFRRGGTVPSIGGIAPGAITGIGWSDHWSFVQHGYAAMMITDTAVFRYPHYHRPTDTPDKIDYERLARVTNGLERVVWDLTQ